MLNNKARLLGLAREIWGSLESTLYRRKRQVVDFNPRGDFGGIMQFKVIIVKSNGSELERLLNDGWSVVQGLGTNMTGLIVIMSKKKDEQKRR